MDERNVFLYKFKITENKEFPQHFPYIPNVALN